MDAEIGESLIDADRSLTWKSLVAIVVAVVVLLLLFCVATAAAADQSTAVVVAAGVKYQSADRFGVRIN